MSKKMKILFTLSVVLNVLFVGIAGGITLKKWSDSPWHKVKEQLSPEAQHLVSKTMQNAFRDLRPQMRESRQAKREMFQILKSDDFDTKKFNEVAQKLQDLNAAMMARRVEVTRSLAQELPAQERAKLARKFSEGFSSGRMKGKRAGHKLKHKDREEGARPYPFLDGVGKSNPDISDEDSDADAQKP